MSFILFSTLSTPYNFPFYFLSFPITLWLVPNLFYSYFYFLYLLFCFLFGRRLIFSFFFLFIIYNTLPLILILFILFFYFLYISILISILSTPYLPSIISFYPYNTLAISKSFLFFLSIFFNFYSIFYFHLFRLSF